jgi:hypothetical protein
MNFIDRLKETISKGYENASDLLSDAAEKAKEMGEKGVIEYEIRKLEKEIENLMPVLGSEIYDLYRNKKLKVLNEAEKAQKLLNEIENKEFQITDKENKLRKMK